MKICCFSDSSTARCLVHRNIAPLPPTCNPASEHSLPSESQRGLCLLRAQTELEERQFLLPRCVGFARQMGTKSSKACTATARKAARQSSHSDRAFMVILQAEVLFKNVKRPHDERNVGAEAKKKIKIKNLSTMLNSCSTFYLQCEKIESIAARSSKTDTCAR